MSVFRGNLRVDHFTIIPNEWLRDRRLTLCDKGLLAYITSHAAGYALTIAQIVAESKNGYDAINTALKHLEKIGYLRRERRRGPNGKLAGYDWHVVDISPGHDQSGKSGTGADQGKHDVPPGHDQSGKSGTGADQGKHDVPPGHDQSGKSEAKKTKKEDKENSPLPPAPTGGVRADPGRDDGGDDPKIERRKPEEQIPTPTVTSPAARIITEYVADLPDDALDQQARHRLTAACQNAFDRRCTRQQILDALSRPLPPGDVINFGALVTSRITALTPAVSSAAQKPPWCGECDERTRMRLTALDQPYRCPECHPLAG
jgi:hypothetical protein